MHSFVPVNVAVKPIKRRTNNEHMKRPDSKRSLDHSLKASKASHTTIKGDSEERVTVTSSTTIAARSDRSSSNCLKPAAVTFNLDGIPQPRAPAHTVSFFTTLQRDLESASKCCVQRAPSESGSDTKCCVQRASSESGSDTKCCVQRTSSESGSDTSGKEAVPSTLRENSRYHGPMEPTFKCLVIGDVGVGKTSFVQKYAHNKNITDYKATLGVDFALKIVQWSDNVTIKIQLWDIAGQERFTSMTRVYYRDAHACIIVFDITREDTFRNASKWKIDLDSKCSLPDGSPIPCMLLANKCDLSCRQVNEDEIEKFCTDYDFICHGEISVKQNKMINESMTFLTRHMLERYTSLVDTCTSLEKEEIVDLERTRNLNSTVAHKNCSC